MQRHAHLQSLQGMACRSGMLKALVARPVTLELQHVQRGLRGLRRQNALRPTPPHASDSREPSRSMVEDLVEVTEQELFRDEEEEGQLGDGAGIVPGGWRNTVPGARPRGRPRSGEEANDLRALWEEMPDPAEEDLFGEAAEADMVAFSDALDKRLYEKHGLASALLLRDYDYPTSDTVGLADIGEALPQAAPVATDWDQQVQRDYDIRAKLRWELEKATNIAIRLHHDQTARDVSRYAQAVWMADLMEEMETADNLIGASCSIVPLWIRAIFRMEEYWDGFAEDVRQQEEKATDRVLAEEQAEREQSLEIFGDWFGYTDPYADDDEEMRGEVNSDGLPVPIDPLEGLMEDVLPGTEAGDIALLQTLMADEGQMADMNEEGESERDPQLQLMQGATGDGLLPYEPGPYAQQPTAQDAAPQEWLHQVDWQDDPSGFQEAAQTQELPAVQQLAAPAELMFEDEPSGFLEAQAPAEAREQGPPQQQQRMVGPTIRSRSQLTEAALGILQRRRQGLPDRDWYAAVKGLTAASTYSWKDVIREIYYVNSVYPSDELDPADDAYNRMEEECDFNLEVVPKRFRVRP